MVDWDPPLATIFLLLMIFLQVNPNVFSEWLQTTEELAVDACWFLQHKYLSQLVGFWTKNPVILECTWKESKEIYVLLGFYFSSQ